MSRIPVDRTAFVKLIEDLFLPLERSALVIHHAQTGGLPATLVHLAGAGTFPFPERSMPQTAADARTVYDARALKQGLAEGRAALHVEGTSGIRLLDSAEEGSLDLEFRSRILANAWTLRQVLRHPDLRVEILPVVEGNRRAVAYLEGTAPGAVVEAMKAWAWEPAPETASPGKWQLLLRFLRLPRTVVSEHPDLVARALRRGYAAVLSDGQPLARVGPSTIDLLLSNSKDLALPVPMRLTLRLLRAGATFLAAVLSAGYVAVTSYHHGLLPGPFLIALASGRQNLPFPTVLEILFLELIDDVLTIGASKLKAEGFNYLPFLGTVLAAMAVTQAGVISPASAAVGIAGAAIRQILPSRSLARTIRIWRYLAIAAAAGLGLYGLALLSYGMMIYLSQEAFFGHPLRRPPAVNDT